MPKWLTVDHVKIHAEGKLLTFVQSFCGALVIMPGHPEHGAFYLVRGLLNALAKYQWQESTHTKSMAYMRYLTNFIILVITRYC